KRLRPINAATIVRRWPATGRGRKSWQKIGVQDRRTGLTQASLRNHVDDPRCRCSSRECTARIGLIGIDKPAFEQAPARISAGESGIERSVREVPGSLQGRRNMSTLHPSLDQPVPFLGYKEEDFVLLDGSANRPSKVIPANLVLLGVRAERFQDGIFGIQNIVPAKIVETAVKVVGA